MKKFAESGKHRRPGAPEGGGGNSPVGSPEGAPSWSQGNKRLLLWDGRGNFQRGGAEEVVRGSVLREKGWCDLAHKRGPMRQKKPLKAEENTSGRF